MNCLNGIRISVYSVEGRNAVPHSARIGYSDGEVRTRAKAIWGQDGMGPSIEEFFLNSRKSGKLMVVRIANQNVT